MRAATTYYEVLGVPENATQDQIQQSFRRLAQQDHPDHARDEDDRKRRTARFQTLSEAYEVLKDPVRRAAYDRTRSVASLWTLAKDRARGSAARVAGVLLEEGECLAREVGRSTVDKSVDYLFGLFNRGAK